MYILLGAYVGLCLASLLEPKVRTADNVLYMLAFAFLLYFITATWGIMYGVAFWAAMVLGSTLLRSR